jgi:hypothetical protein
MSNTSVDGETDERHSSKRETIRPSSQTVNSFRLTADWTSLWLSLLFTNP